MPASSPSSRRLAKSVLPDSVIKTAEVINRGLPFSLPANELQLAGGCVHDLYFGDVTLGNPRALPVGGDEGVRFFADWTGNGNDGAAGAEEQNEGG